MNRADYLAIVRSDIEMHRAIIAELSAKGLEAREYILIDTDDEFRMDRSLCSLGVLSRRCRAVLTEMYAEAVAAVHAEEREIRRAA